MQGVILLFVLLANSCAIADESAEAHRAGASQPSNTVLAFPGAEGYGALAIGGRGGRIIEVTNLNDSGPGSLRDAVMATGPRIVVFRVGGTIELKSDLIIRGEERAYLTIAGQTAPGDGILLKKYGLWIMDTHDIVIRYLRIRVGYWGAEGGAHGILIYGYEGAAHDIIFDHCSVSWILDDNSMWGKVSNVTLQWCIFAEASNKGRDGQDNDCGKYGGCGLMWGPRDEVTYMSVHHNLLIHNYYRNPACGGGTHQFINNIIYNPGWSATFMGVFGQQFPINIDFIGNYYKSGPNTRAGIKEISFETDDASAIHLYLRDNYGWNYNPNDPYAIVMSKNYNKRSLPLAPGPAGPVTIHGFEEAKGLVIGSVGASFPRRDAVDVRLITEFNAGAGSLGIGSDFPVIANGGPPADSDRDGMADGWEIAHGLNPNNAADGNQDKDGDGYLNVEEYLNELADGVTPPASLIANISVNTSAGPAPLTIQFRGSAAGGKAPYTYNWDFGDGSTSNLQNPAHTYQQANSYMATLTVTDGENRRASASQVINVVSPLNVLPQVVEIRVTDAARATALSTINPGQWYDLYLYVDDPQGWNDIAFADVWLSHESYTGGAIANRGGKFFGASNYVMSYSIADGGIWARQTEGSEDWTEVGGRLGLYVDDDNNEYEQSGNQKWAKARIRLLPRAQTGSWTINAYVIDKQKQKSMLAQKPIQVWFDPEIPTAVVTLGSRRPLKAGAVQVTLTTSKEVVRVPTPLFFIESDRSITNINLNGTVPGKNFTGTFVVDDSTANGIGRFWLPNRSLVAANGKASNKITSGVHVRIDRTPPAAPQSVKWHAGPSSP
jgi:PKD repeat protein